MTGRLTPERRRAEIIATTRQMIAENGPEGLSMRAVARRCEMTGPGVTHHFPSMAELLTAVLDQRDVEDEAAVIAEVTAHGDDASLLLLIDTYVRYYAERPVETRNFDRLEAEALNPAHPAHSYYVGKAPRARTLVWQLAERDYVDPPAIVPVLWLTVSGLHSRWLRSPGSDLWQDWAAVRVPLFNSFVRKDGKPTIP